MIIDGVAGNRHDVWYQEPIHYVVEPLRLELIAILNVPKIVGRPGKEDVIGHDDGSLPKEVSLFKPPEVGKVLALGVMVDEDEVEFVHGVLAGKIRDDVLSLGSDDSDDLPSSNKAWY